MNETQGLNDDFVFLTQDIKAYLIDIKQKNDKFDQREKDRKKRIVFLLSSKDEVFYKLSARFKQIWEIAANFNEQSYKPHESYYRKELGPLLLNVEINKHIYKKPLGYSGDYLTMNYIYDYHDRYLGESSYDILINLFTCTIPISNSNIERKEYFKKEIQRVLSQSKEAHIASIGSGSARELMELLDMGEINKPVNYTCVDFEPKALHYIQEEILKRKKNDFLNMHYVVLDIRDIIKSDKINEKLSKKDFIYASGMYDYLTDRFAKRLTPILYNLLNKSGYMVIVNAKLESSEMRAYYEMLGDWKFNHRTKDQIFAWTQALTDVRSISFDDLFFPNNYYFLKISR